MFDRYKVMPNYGKGKEQKEKFWNELFAKLLKEGYLREKAKSGGDGFSFTVLGLHTKSQGLVQNDKSSKTGL